MYIYIRDSRREQKRERESTRGVGWIGYIIY